MNWKFLPKTAALLDLSWFDRIPNSTLYSVASTGMRAQAGVTGLVTAHFAATVKAGYGTTLDLSLDPLAVPQPDLSQLGTWLATVSAEWLPSTLSSLKLTYSHDLGVDPGLTYSLYTIGHVTLDGKSKLNSTLSAAIVGDWAILSYRDATSSTSNILTVKPSLRADLSRWLQLELAYQYTNRTSDLRLPAPGLGVLQERDLVAGRRHLLVPDPGLMSVLRIVAAVLSLVVSGCAGPGARSGAPAEPAVTAGLPASTLGPNDIFEVRVYQEPELSGLYQVGPQGDIMFPLCKQVVVTGLTANGVAEKLRACLSEGYLRSPQVSVLVKEFNSRKVFVFGEVQKPGTFAFEDGMSVVQALTLAGGFTKQAAPNSTSVTRHVSGQEVKMKVNVQDIALGKAANFKLEPGDIVFVPESMF